MGSPPSGYEHPAYAAAVAEPGAVRALPRAGGAVIVREIAGTRHRDAAGPYPIFSCSDWTRLDADLSDLSGYLVSVAVVVDPFGGWTEELLRGCFPDRLLRFKEHFVVELGDDPLAHVHPHHRRNIALGLRELEVEVVTDLDGFVREWQALYCQLIARHRIRGPAAFSGRSLAAQLAVPGMVALRALRDGAPVGATLWYQQNGVAYYHLGAYAPEGYTMRASFALFARALELFSRRGLAWASLGAGAGVTTDPDDGLSRFKRGWATEKRVAWFGGRVLRPDVYDRLARAGASSSGFWFPAYREGEIR